MDFSSVGNPDSINHISLFEQAIDLSLDFQEANQTIVFQGKFAEHYQGEVDIFQEQFLSRRNYLTSLFADGFFSFRGSRTRRCRFYRKRSGKKARARF
jgi:hypothetical protein